MLRHIEALREKPKAVRNHYAFTIALSVTLLIVAVWAISLPARLAFEEPIITKAADTGPSFSEQLSDINTFFGQGLEDIKTQAELIGAAEVQGDTAESAIDAGTIMDPNTDTAHYDFFPATPSLDGSVSEPQGNQNQ